MNFIKRYISWIKEIPYVREGELYLRLMSLVIVWATILAFGISFLWPGFVFLYALVSFIGALLAVFCFAEN